MFPNMNDNIFELEGRRGQRQRISWSLKVAPLSHLDPSVFSPTTFCSESGGRGGFPTNYHILNQGIRNFIPKLIPIPDVN